MSPAGKTKLFFLRLGKTCPALMAIVLTTVFSATEMGLEGESFASSRDVATAARNAALQETLPGSSVCTRNSTTNAASVSAPLRLPRRPSAVRAESSACRSSGELQMVYARDVLVCNHGRRRS